MHPAGNAWIDSLIRGGACRDSGGGVDGQIFSGVTSPFGSYGLYRLGQGIWTTMSYDAGHVIPGSFNADPPPLRRSRAPGDAGV